MGDRPINILNIHSMIKRREYLKYLFCPHPAWCKLFLAAGDIRKCFSRAGKHNYDGWLCSALHVNTLTASLLNNITSSSSPLQTRDERVEVESEIKVFLIRSMSQTLILLILYIADIQWCLIKNKAVFIDKIVTSFSYLTTCIGVCLHTFIPYSIIIHKKQNT